jgi:hypothetical protein
LRNQTVLLEKLFSQANFDELAKKSRTELLTILQGNGISLSGPFEERDDQLDGSQQLNESRPVSPGGEAVGQRQWDESRHQMTTQQAADDINAMDLATDHHRRSYLGVNSISAILRCIFRLCPSAKHLMAERAKSWSGQQTIQPSLLPTFSFDTGLNNLRDQRCIDFYFEHIHAIVPMLDEEEFRANFASGSRRDPGWLGLFYMVLILGSIASGSDTLHSQYYPLARTFLDLDTLGAGNIESLQALTLLGGMYLHYRNAPNMGYAILGAAQRIGIALGLHRESRKRNLTDTEVTPGRISRVEIGRRTWWSLFCLDTWASMTFGRPTSGRWEASTMDTRLPSPSSKDDNAVSSLVASCHFCLISTRIQNRFAQFNRLSVVETLVFDKELQAWYMSLPPVLISAINSPSRLSVAREFMRNRYYNLRLILLRSLILCMIRNHAQADQMFPEATEVINNCRCVAVEAIEVIALYWTPNRIHAWNAAWYLFQACMVPILLFAIEKSQGQPNMEFIDMVKASLSKALETFTEMRLWMKPSDRSPDIIAALFEAVSSEAGDVEKSPSLGDSNFSGWCDDQFTFTELDWNIFLGSHGPQYDKIQNAQDNVVDENL